jgi:hypothetical protein
VGTPNGAPKRKGQAMSTKTMNVIALGAGGALVAVVTAIATASPSWTMPVLPNTVAVTTAASNPITDVQYYRRGYHRHGYYGRGYGRRYYGRGYYGGGYYRRGYYGGGYGYPYGGYPYAYSYPYSYAYPYSYSYPFSFGFGWGGW